MNPATDALRMVEAAEFQRAETAFVVSLRCSLNLGAISGSHLGNHLPFDDDDSFPKIEWCNYDEDAVFSTRKRIISERLRFVLTKELGLPKRKSRQGKFATAKALKSSLASLGKSWSLTRLGSDNFGEYCKQTKQRSNGIFLVRSKACQSSVGSMRSAVALSFKNRIRGPEAEYGQF
jgi:hypothetical protein